MITPFLAGLALGTALGALAVLAWMAWRRPVAQIETDEPYGM